MTSLEEKYENYFKTTYFLLHLWTTATAYLAKGIVAAIVTFFLFVFADVYWCAKTFIDHSINIYSIAVMVFAIVFAYMWLTPVAKKK